MERLEIHSKSFLIKWVNAGENSVINWQVKPNKKSINVGLFRKVSAEFNLAGGDNNGDEKNGTISSGNLTERLQMNGLEKVIWHGKCVADDFVRGSYTVEAGQGGMYALVFDNTFSKNTAKTVLFSQQLTSDKDHKLPEKVRTDSQVSGILQLDESNHNNTNSEGTRGIEKPPQRSNTTQSSNTNNNVSTCVSDGRYITGMLLKKRRKRLQGYGRRYFCLDYKYGLLNYFLDQKSSLLRGSMPIQLCVISANQKSRDIFIDSGMEVWSLRALTPVDFETWVQALDVARQSTAPQKQDVGSNGSIAGPVDNDSAEWDRIKTLVSQLEATIPKANNEGGFSTSQTSLPESVPPTPEIPSEHKPDAATAQNNNNNTGNGSLHRKSSFWRRKSSATSNNNDNNRRSSANSQATMRPYNNNNPSSESVNNIQQRHSADWHDLIGHLTEIVSDFKKVLSEHDEKQETAAAYRQKTVASQSSAYNDIAQPRDSFDSIWSEEMFYDANEQFDGGGVVYVDVESSGGEEDDNDDDDELSSLSDDEENVRLRTDVLSQHRKTLHHEDLYPLPIVESVKRRETIPDQKGSAPSLISVLRKNVGKDLTTIAMPVTMNEPLSILQRLSECVEHTYLIDNAVASSDPVERAMLVGLFGITFLSGFRSKERCSRKSFNPLLGETFELVREDKGYRFIAEKISHRPVGFALQAESKDWTVQYSGYPRQKIWGKSAEFSDPGPFRVTINETGEVFEFIQPSIFMRNLIAGEKYMEPVGSITVYSSSGAKSVVTFKAGGMFSGRSEELSITGYDANGNQSETEYQGTWTSQVGVFSGPTKGTVLWKAGNLIKNQEKKYGFSEFVASLNEITPIEENSLAPTDSRLRPDQRLYEQGKIDEAEKKKQELEEKQRTKRHEMEANNTEWKPAFFQLGGSDNDFYTLKEGEDNYWERRKQGKWESLEEIF